MGYGYPKNLIDNIERNKMFRRRVYDILTTKLNLSLFPLITTLTILKRCSKISVLRLHMKPNSQEFIMGAEIPNRISNCPEYMK